MECASPLSSLPTKSRSRQIKENLRHRRTGDGAKVGRVAPRAPRIGVAHRASTVVPRHGPAWVLGLIQPDRAEGQSWIEAAPSPIGGARGLPAEALAKEGSTRPTWSWLHRGMGFGQEPPKPPTLVLSAPPHAICGKADLVGNEQPETLLFTHDHECSANCARRCVRQRQPGLRGRLGGWRGRLRVSPVISR